MLGVVSRAFLLERRAGKTGNRLAIVKNLVGPDRSRPRHGSDLSRLRSGAIDEDLVSFSLDWHVDLPSHAVETKLPRLSDKFPAFTAAPIAFARPVEFVMLVLALRRM